MHFHHLENPHLFGLQKVPFTHTSLPVVDDFIHLEYSGAGHWLNYLAVEAGKNTAQLFSGAATCVRYAATFGRVSASQDCDVLTRYIAHDHCSIQSQYRSDTEAQTRSKPTCTSYEGILSGTASGVIAFKRACQCSITITGGTSRDACVVPPVDRGDISSRLGMKSRRLGSRLVSRA